VLSVKDRSVLRGVTLEAVKPASSDRTQVRLPVRSMAVARGVGIVELGGGLRFKAGKRSITATALRLSAGTTSSSLSGKLGKARVTLFAARGRPVLSPGRVAINAAKTALTPAAAAKLKAALKLRRAPSTAALGVLDLAAPVAPAPAPAPVTTAPAPAPSTTPTPTPEPGCSESATPLGSVDWYGCQLPGEGDLKSWSNYVLRPFPPACGLGAGSITETGGAQRLATLFDHRFPVTSTVNHLDGRTTIYLAGTVTYTMPAHGIDESLGELEIELAADRLSGKVFADGRSNPRNATVCPGAATVYADELVLDLVPAGGSRWTATIDANTDKVGGGVYGAGAQWGAFVIP
jgi:Htaa